jgi:succinate dehydrogenase / fumarate reductase cytochrome b subunit
MASLLAVAPLGVWTVLHVWSNLAAYDGAGAWQRSVTEHAHPAATFFTSALVLVPLLLHTIWGIQRLRTMKPNNARYGTFENLKYLLQRASAVGVLLFLGAHLWLAFLHPRFVEGRPEQFGDIAHEMHHHGPTLLVYVLGTLGVAYHLANGLHGFAMGWGLVVSKDAMKKAQRASLVFFALLLAASWGAIFGLYRAGA